MPPSIGAVKDRPVRGGAGRLADVLRRELDIDLVALEPVVGGFDERAAVWQGVDTADRLWSVKSTGRDCRFGLSLAASLAAAGVPGVAAPRLADDGRPWTVHRGVLVSATPWILGEDAFDSRGEAVSWEGFGAILRAVHHHEPPSLAEPARRGIRRARRPMGHLLAEVDARVSRALGDGPVLEAGSRVDDADRWATSRARLERLARAERRLKRRRTPTSRVALHGDPHLGNLVVDEELQPWLIDFDESTVAPREVDLMLVELGVTFSVPVTDAQRAAFRAGYGDAAIDEARIARFGCVRAIEDATATALRWLDASPERRAGLDDLVAGQFGPDGLVTLAERELDRLGA